jgi:8-oxo-dGTP pyrophosphatase MutT (NUDIX family)
MRIEQLGPPDADHSTGLILRWRDRLLFALEPRRNWRDREGTLLARFVGIGGHLEAGETWVQAVRREAREEADLDVTLLSPETTTLLLGDGTIQDISAALDWSIPPRPLFIWSARFRFGRPPNEWERHFVNAVFLAAVPDEAEPRPAAEMEAILAITGGQLCRAARQPVFLGTLLDGGTTVWTSFPIPRSTLVTPGGTAQWYATLLNHQTSNQ